VALELTRPKRPKRSAALTSSAVSEDARRAGLPGILALNTLAEPDPVAALFKRTKGKVGETHTLDY
jgi:hypothetical protein